MSEKEINVKAYADCVLALRGCKPTEGIEILDNLKTALVNSYQKQLDEQKLYGLFNLFELHKDWEKDFETWRVDTLKLTQFEEQVIEQLTSNVLPRHMPIHDWNLPYAEGIILVLRRLLMTFQENGDKSMKEIHIHKVCWKCGKRFDSSKETFEHIEKEHITKK